MSDCYDGMGECWMASLVEQKDDQISALETRLAAAEADAERLDWLDRNLQMKNGWRVGVAKAGNIVVTSVGNNSTGIRAAIDAARGGE